MTALILAIALSLQTPALDSWSRAVTALAPAARVRVTVDGGAIEGAVDDVAVNHIALRVGRDVVRVSRDRVIRIDEPAASASRWKRAGIGFAAGLAIGSALYALACRGECRAEGVVIASVPGELFGAAIGAAWPTTRWREIYRASR